MIQLEDLAVDAVQLRDHVLRRHAVGAIGFGKNDDLGLLEGLLDEGLRVLDAALARKDPHDGLVEPCRHGRAPEPGAVVLHYGANQVL